MKTKYIILIFACIILIGIALSNTDTETIEIEDENTVKYCKEVCNNEYSTQIQTTICKNNCIMYKDGTSELQRYINIIEKGGIN